MAKLKLEPKSGLKWKYNWRTRPSYPDDFTVSFDISLRNKRCEGKYLECMLNLFSNFNSFEVSLGDLLQAHNYNLYGHPDKGILDSKKCRQISIQEGDNWLVNNKHIIDKALKDKEVTIVRWEKWENNPLISLQEERIRSLLSNNDDLKNALLKDVNRLEKYWKYPLSKSAEGNVGNYIIEEIAVYMFQTNLNNYVHVYPGGKLNTLECLRNMESAPTNIRNSDHAYLFLK